MEILLPLLFLDVDGPLIPFGGGGGYPEYLTERQVRELTGEWNPMLARIDPAVGGWLGALPARLVWATTWMADANACVAPVLGLPELPVLDEPADGAGGFGWPPVGLHWKTPAVVARAAGGAFAWVDDEITAVDRAWVAEHHAGPALLHRVNPRTGLTGRDFEELDAWLRDAGR
ncbi:hypothetical protein ACIQBJ_08425 [Kitasatospora sp. NPDC088391]|uniref:hypothetical protein n=1 Tax=Kitasatospora sp. NPDC088391 TaxID=3364074 RepID=UPI00381C4159